MAILILDYFEPSKELLLFKVITCIMSFRRIGPATKPALLLITNYLLWIMTWKAHHGPSLLLKFVKLFNIFTGPSFLRKPRYLPHMIEVGSSPIPLRSASTIILVSSLKVVLWTHPNFSLALVLSPKRDSTSVGRK